VKNAKGATYDTPDSARLTLLWLHSQWVVAAGVLLLTYSVPLYMTGVEVSPLCSYAGENLEAISEEGHSMHHVRFHSRHSSCWKQQSDYRKTRSAQF